MKEGFTRIFNCFNFKPAIPYIAGVVGIILAIIGFVDYIKLDQYIKEISKWGSATLLSGVIVGFMTTYAQFRGLFKNELEDVIYKYEFLRKRRDIAEIWESVSKVLFDSKFPEISNDLLKIIKEKYLPIEHISYCRDSDTMITISWDNKEQKLIRVIQEESFEIITFSDNEFSFSGLFTVDVNPTFSDIEENRFEELNNLIDCNIVINECKVNDVDYPFSERKYLKDSVLSCNLNIILRGSECYRVKRRMTKVYNINHDYNIGFRAKTVLNNSRVRVFNEIFEDIELTFISRGTLNDFKELKKRDNYLEYEYKGLILQKQGYIIILKQK